MRRIHARFVVLPTVTALARLATAQTAAIGGTVFRDTAAHPLGGAQVVIPSLDRGARTNYLGEFRLDRIPAGKYAVMIRSVGFAPFVDSIVVKDGQVVDRDFIMTPSPVTLDSQRVVATTEMDEPHVAEFEERRKLGFGHFIDTKELRKIESGRPVMNYIASTIPGLAIYRPDPASRPTDYYISSGHGGKCPIAIFVDGSAWFVPTPHLRPGDPPDISHLSADDYSAVEYYASGATAPPRFNQTQMDCGILLLWRRYKR